MVRGMFVDLFRFSVNSATERGRGMGRTDLKYAVPSVGTMSGRKPSLKEVPKRIQRGEDHKEFSEGKSRQTSLCTARARQVRTCSST